MCHAVEGRERDIVAGFHDLAVCEAERITLDDLFGESLWDFWGCSQGGKNCRGIGIFSLRMEHILESLCRRCEGSEAGSCGSERDKIAGWSGPQTLQTEALLKVWLALR